MRVTCFQCEQRVGSYTYESHDDEDGHGTQPVCDQCSGIYIAPVSGLKPGWHQP